ncbi:DNA double-strand break repair Rad50 ATPase [Operophtera brumata]|uniref:DNA double-strand break repair Rad50 ATPase n=1 Tax=Operophtera brumata TaxID=104452 RepID=A0A0L7LE39_OPEBR|nr:DNA double-strand break repair Rad50 ATPase [Operophtera brumata]
MSTDYAGRRHMLNAISAVLHFTSAERSMLAAILDVLMSTDYAGSRHMLNAIAAVLHFTSEERSMLSAIL